MDAGDRRQYASERLDLGLARVGTWEWNPDTGTFSLSPTCRRILPLSHSLVTVGRLSELIHADDLPHVRGLAEACLRGAGEVRAEFRVRGANAGWRWVEVAGRRLRRAGDPAGRVVGIVIDVSARKRAEAERDLLQMAGHDIRTPLNAVLGWCHVLSRRVDRPEQVREVVEVIERNARSLARIVDDMAMGAHGLVEAGELGGGGTARTTHSAPAPRPPVERLEGVRILVIDDDRDSREWVRQILMHAGAVVDAAATCAEGLELYGRARPAVVVTDIDLPDQDGYGLLRTLRSPLNGPPVPAVAVTALARPSDARAALEAGFQAHMAKPISPGELCGTILRLATAARSEQPPQAASDGAASPRRRTP